MSDPWELIDLPASPNSLALQRADAEHPLDFFRGRDHQGNYLFCYQGAILSADRIKLPRFEIMELALERIKDDMWQFSIRLVDKSQIDLYRALCMNLMDATRVLARGKENAGVDIVLTRLLRWQELLRKLNERRLSAAQVIGLFGELLLLRDVFLLRLGAYEAVGAWHGAEGHEQDFAWGDWLIELKTQLSSSDAKLQIASENQLDARSGEIMVCHQTLVAAGSADTGSLSLNEIVGEIERNLSNDFGTTDRFRATLCEFGYIRCEEYDMEFWKLAQRAYYRVGTGFPCLTPTQLPIGVEQVQYTVKISACQEFLMSEGEAEEKMFAQ